MNLSGTFSCRRRDRTLTDETCYDDFVTAHGLLRLDDPCYVCPRGAALRVMVRRDRRDLPTAGDVATTLYGAEAVKALRPVGQKGPHPRHRFRELLKMVVDEEWWVETFVSRRR